MSEKTYEQGRRDEQERVIRHGRTMLQSIAEEWAPVPGEGEAAMYSNAAIRRFISEITLGHHWHDQR